MNTSSEYKNQSDKNFFKIETKLYKIHTCIPVLRPNFFVSQQTCSGASMQVDSHSSTLNGSQMIIENDSDPPDSQENGQNVNNAEENVPAKDPNKTLTFEDLSLLCDLFYLPFEHGGQAIQLLQEFNWLKSNADIVIKKGKDETASSKADVNRLFLQKIKFSIFYFFKFYCRSTSGMPEQLR